MLIIVNSLKAVNNTLPSQEIYTTYTKFEFMNTQKYSGKAVDMLTACQIITEQAKSDKDFLIACRPSWADPFFDNNLVRIADCFANILGVSNASKLRTATQLVNSIQHEAINSIQIFKMQVEQDFKKDPIRRTEILKTLGFSLLTKARKSQEILVQLLYQFKNNMTDSLRNEIIAKGISVPTINTVIAFADQLEQANVIQEMLKGSNKTLSQQAMAILNGIYSDSIAIAIIARGLFKGNKAKQDIYSYTKTLKKLNNATVSREKASDEQN
jgi:hypothetical protein